MTLDEVNLLLEKVSNFTDEDIETYVKLLVEKELIVDEYKMKTLFKQLQNEQRGKI